MAAVSFGASAEGYRSVAVNIIDGSKVEINLADDLTAAFDEENLLIASDGQDVAIPRATIKSFTFSDKEVVGLDQVSAGAAPVVSGGKMIFTELPAGSVVAVYNTAGALLTEQKASGDFTLDLSTLPAQTVIVNVNGVAYKIATK